MALAELPTTIIHLILSFLHPREAFVCSGICKNFHTAASYFFYEEYVKEHWTLPSTPSAVIDFFMMKSRQLWTLPLAALSTGEPRPHEIQGVQAVAQGFRFQAFLLHTHELLLVKNGAVCWSTRFDKPVEEICAGVTTIGVLLRGGNVEMLRLVEDRTDRELVPMQEIVTHICISFDRLVFSTESQQVFAWDGAAIQQISFDPPVTSSVTSLDCHSKIAMILFEGGHLYKLEGSALVAIQDPFFKKKPIGLIASGLLHSLALQREELPPLASWTTPELLQWLESNGFSDCIGVVTHSKITGKNLEEADEDFFVDVLGIRETERANRLKYLRTQVHARSVSSQCTLFGWGKNADSQLAKAEATIHHPVAIDLPKFKKNENIKSLYCSKTYSFLLTSAGRVFAVGGTKPKNRPQGIEVLPWIDLTPTLTCGQSARSIEEMVPGSDELLFMVLKRDQRDLPQKRLKGANLIMKQILWDPKLNFTEFVVGYEDRFLGIIEVTAADFSKSEIPSHRIRYYKRAGEIVWDRRTRMNRL